MALIKISEIFIIKLCFNFFNLHILVLAITKIQNIYFVILLAGRHITESIFL